MTCPMQRALKLLLGIGLAGIADASRGQEELRLDPQELGDPPALLVALAFAERFLDRLECIIHLADSGQALRERAEKHRIIWHEDRLPGVFPARAGQHR